MSNKVKNFMQNLQKNGHQQRRDALQYDSSKYLPGILFKGVQCHKCKRETIMTDKIICRTFDELTKRAERQHLDIYASVKLTDTLAQPCTEPLLIIDYAMCFIQIELFEALQNPNIIL